MKLSESVKPISYLKSHAADIIKSFSKKELHTIIVTQNGEAKAVLMDIHEYENNLETMRMMKILLQSNVSLQQGKYKPAKKAFDDIRRKIKQVLENNTF